MNQISLFLLFFIVGIASAQALSPGGIITDRPSAERLPVPELVPDKKPPGFTLPPAPSLPSKTIPGGGPTVVVKGFRFSGQSVFTEQELQVIAAPYLGRAIGATDLEQLRHQLTQNYVEHGYVNSGAILPKQVFKDGIIEFRMIEGELSEIRVTGTEWLHPDYVRDRLYLGAGPPLNNQELQDRFQLLLTDPLIERMDGRLMPGLKPGESILDVKVSRAQPYQLSFSADNYKPPSIGAEQVRMDGWVRNITGFGDIVALSLGYSEGSFDIDTSVAVPINRYDTVLGFRYADNRSSVIEEPLDDVDIDNEFRVFEIGLTHPVYRTLERKIEVGALLAVRKSRNTLLGRPFSFSLGEDDGESKVTALRLSQELVDNSWANQVISFRSTFSVGLKLFDATWHGDGRPDGDYFAWLGQLQYARQVMDNGAQIRFRGNVQLTDDQLLPLERFAVGGVYSVRGYRENELVRDLGYDLSVEFHYPLLGNGFAESFPGVLTFVPFMDYGAAWNRDDRKNIRYLHSVGAGLLWNHRRINTEFYYAHDLNQAVGKPDYDLQDSGVHFRVTAYVF